MAVKSCPKCKTQVEVMPGEKPVCHNCGFGSSAPQQTYAEPEPMYADPEPAYAHSSAPPTGGALTSGSSPVVGRLRTVSVAKVFFLSLITFGIYMWVTVYKMSGDLGRASKQDNSWEVLFWIGLFIPFIWWFLYFGNNKRCNEIRESHGMAGSYMPFIFMFIPILNIAAPFVWASHYNAVASRT
ncbi:MAG: DUF4234 domain-containing protein [Thermoplasmatota archaeon]